MTEAGFAEDREVDAMMRGVVGHRMSKGHGVKPGLLTAAREAVKGIRFDDRKAFVDAIETVYLAHEIEGDR